MPDAEWMFADHASGPVARLAPWNWSGGLDIAACKQQLQDLKEKDRGRPIVLKIPSGVMSYERRGDSVEAALKELAQFHPEDTEPVLEPRWGPCAGGVEVRWVGAEPAPVSLKINGERCELVSDRTFMVPALKQGDSAQTQSGAQVSVTATFENGTIRSFLHLFEYFPPGFGLVGENIELSGPATARRKDGASNLNALCIAKDPLKPCKEEYEEEQPHQVSRRLYFEVEILEVEKDMRTFAVGFARAPPENSRTKEGRLLVEDATSLEGSWVMGYDKSFLEFSRDREMVEDISATVRRRVTDVVQGTRIGVLWDQGPEGVEMAVFQDGTERVRLPVRGEGVPKLSEDLYALIDLQGTVRSVTFRAPCGL